MSPARLSFGDLPTPDGSLCGSWPSKMNASRMGMLDVDLVDDIKTLWETKWKYACRRQIHPFQDAHYEDFATIFPKLFSLGVTSAHDIAYTDTFYQLAQDLTDDAARILVQHDSDGAPLAAQQLLRACALLRVARFPYATGDENIDTRSTTTSHAAEDFYALKKDAYALQKELYLRAMRLLDVDGLAPLEEVRVPHVHDPATHPSASSSSSSGRHFDMGIRSHPTTKGGGAAPHRRPHIPMYVRVPLDTLLTGRQCPVLLILSADRTGETARCEEALARGWAAVVVERPGAGESPVRRGDGPEAEARLWSSVLDWMRGMYFYDMERVVVVGDGAAATRLAESHGARLKGVVVRVVDDEEQQQQQQQQQHQMADETTADFAAVQCPVLIADERRGGAKNATSNEKVHGRQWTLGPGDEDMDVDDFMQLSEYRRETTGCVGQMRTSDVGRVYGWMEDVMEMRETQIRELDTQSSSSSCPGYPAGSSKMLWWVDQWKPPSPPHSEAGKGGLWFPRAVHDDTLA